MLILDFVASRLIIVFLRHGYAGWNTVNYPLYYFKFRYHDYLLKSRTVIEIADLRIAGSIPFLSVLKKIHDFLNIFALGIGCTYYKLSLRMDHARMKIAKGKNDYGHNITNERISLSPPK